MTAITFWAQLLEAIPSWQAEYPDFCCLPSRADRIDERRLQQLPSRRANRQPDPARVGQARDVALRDGNPVAEHPS
jgi:hypothetical protein